ncbi:two-component sensor histidine kinase, partial [Streptomyces rubiginosohelvolus]
MQRAVLAELLVEGPLQVVAVSGAGLQEPEEGARSSVTREVGRTLLIIGAVALLAIVSAVLLAV